MKVTAPSLPAAEARLLDDAQVTELTRVTPRKRNALIAKGRFPKPVWIDARTKVWPESDIREWIAEQIAARDRGALPLGVLMAQRARAKGAANSPVTKPGRGKAGA